MTDKQLEPPPAAPSVQPSCTCWLGRNAPGGDARERMACAVHGEASPPSPTPASGAMIVPADLRQLLCDVSQLLAGWHADGTVWSEWDESVWGRVIAYQRL